LPFFRRPSGIAAYLWKGFVSGGKLWLELGYTLTGTLASFVGGSLCTIAVGLLFMLFPGFHRGPEPNLTLLNAMPRIALAPLFLLGFGLGLEWAAANPRSYESALADQRSSCLPLLGTVYSTEYWLNSR